MNRLLKLAALFSWIVAGMVSLADRRTRPGGAPAGEEPEPKENNDRQRTRWKRRLLVLAALGVVLALGGFLGAASGIIPIKASSGHWAITEWFLQFSKRRSVSTHTLGMKVPPLDEPQLVLKGAGHYEIGCRPCHGSPALQHPRIAAAMLPPPPYLPPRVPEWDPEELFYIVKHGIKFTGMPAWPALQRDDEVWAMVAFLQEFPELSAEEYEELAKGEAATGDETPPLAGLPESEPALGGLLERCVACHGREGAGRGLGAYPTLAGQKPVYLERSLQAYADGQRHSGIMEPVAAGLNSEQIAKLARYYGGLEARAPSPADEQTATAIERGRAIAHEGIPSQRIPACIGCHGPSPIRRNPTYPLLAGQYAEYLELQLELFKKGHRGGTEYAHLMQMVAGHLESDQIRDVALYYASQDSGLNGAD